jgi:hypothetical protein
MPAAVAAVLRSYQKQKIISSTLLPQALPLTDRRKMA